MLEFRRRLFIEEGELHAVESGQPFARADPEVAFPGLGDGMDRILRQAIIRLPDTHAIGRGRVGRGLAGNADRQRKDQRGH